MKPLDRRRLIVTAAMLAAAPSLATAGPARKGGRLPKGFLWGAATAAHQVEGNNVNSDVWLLEGLEGTPFADRSLDACDHYHRYDEDIALLHKFGLNTYRFSIEWARIEPAQGLFSQAEIGHYRRVLESCKRRGMTTVVTLHHFTSPLWFSAQGGFERPEAAELFARYAAYVVAQLGDQIDWLCTFNEANLSFAPQPKMIAAAAAATNSPAFSSFLFASQGKAKPGVKAAHLAARKAIKAAAPKLPVGYTLAISDYQASEPAAQVVAERYRKAMYGSWLELARGDDFIGVQTYTRELIGPRGPLPVPETALKTQLGQEFYPKALEGTIRYAASVAQVPVLVTENGVGIDEDAKRIEYIDTALAGLKACLDDGLDVRGYIHWSAMDNFEWLAGYGPKFGLVAVDRATQTRRPKPSAYHLGRIAKANRL